MSDLRPHSFPAAGKLQGGPAWMSHRSPAVSPILFPGPGGVPTIAASQPDEDDSRISDIPLEGEEPMPRKSAAPPAPPPGPPPIPADDPRLVAFARAAADLGAARAQILASVEGQLLELALAIASSIIEREIELDPELHQGLARAALATLGSAPGARLRASREAHAAIVAALGSPVVTADGIEVQLTMDPTLEGLGCIAENEHTRVDGRVGERLRAVLRSLEDERRRVTQEDAG